MRRWIVGLGVAAAIAAGPAWAQEARSAEDDATRPEPVIKIRVLENPYDIASFYRSDQSRGAEPGVLLPEGVPTGPYAVAGFYRQGAASRGRYGVFWTNGYGWNGRWPARRPGVGPAPGFYRSIGENGDLFLLAPTFLAPIGPLNEAFYGQR
jgi:hypothetical protein